MNTKMDRPQKVSALINDTITDFKPINNLEQKLNAAWRLDEATAVSHLLTSVKQDSITTQKVQTLATKIAQNLRDRKTNSGKAGVVQGLLQEFSLSSNEGIALMCLAEALLRIPDKKTRDLLIKDKINQGNWKDHIGQSNLMFVNAATWGLIITDKLVATPDRVTLSSLLTTLIGKFGKAIIRKSVDTAMRIMGEQFVTGETIQEALSNSQKLQNQGFRYSYDMLGEAALTEEDAERYFQDYLNAIHFIGESANGAGIYQSAGISIKLSALHPRYQRAQIQRVYSELYPKLLQLVELAKQYNIGINIDAEESERLELSLGLLEKLCFEPSLKNWNGIGFVIQAYQKRCYYLIDYIIDLAKRSRHRLMIRLVKGAYWDSEIKKAQIDGMSEFPVFTRKVYTDLSYLACAKKLLAAEKEIFPQFATHNAQTLSAIYYMAGPETYHLEQYEFQCLHGMGEPLYEQVVGNKSDGKLGVPCRIYAPVGNHETLLAYLVRRLLENGANSSFVNRIADKSIKIEEIVANPFDEVASISKKEGFVGKSHKLIKFPKNLYGEARQNSDGYDLNNDTVLHELVNKVNQLKDNIWSGLPLIGDTTHFSVSPDNQAVKNPANHQDIVGYLREANLNDVEKALTFAQNANSSWANTPVEKRAGLLLAAAEQLEKNIDYFMVLLSRESGKTYPNGIAEVREAVDFLRYYASQGKTVNKDLKAPLGTILCISPWNFPLAIFLGQISAALVAGNTVIAKPAEQTPLIATEAIKLLWQAGLPKDVIQLLPGQGETIGAALSKDSRINGIMFTGSTEVAKILQRTVSSRVTQTGQSIPLIAETGGQNALFVDSSALTEQVVLDVVSSAFDSAGQRCSALRILCVQEDCYDNVLKMLKGATKQLHLGNPAQLSTDIGPVIDSEAQNNILSHIQKMHGKGYPVHQFCFNEQDKMQENKKSTFVLPTIIELPHLNELTREIFGPVLHVIKYKYGELEKLLDAVNEKGYGLTMGLHTRIDETIAKVISKAHVGNLYINRNIVGAVVGVQPFGGEGLSGTGPKAGGPLYLHKLTSHSDDSILRTPFGVVKDVSPNLKMDPSTLDFYNWVNKNLSSVKLEVIQDAIYANKGYELPGPTGESDSYYIVPRSSILAVSNNLIDQISQIHTILSIGSKACILANSPFTKEVYGKLPESIKARIKVYSKFEDIKCEVIIHHGSEVQLLQLQQESAKKLPNIVTIVHLKEGEKQIPLSHLVHERAISINTTAAGGNTSLMMLES
ncbi:MULTISPECIES: trifunctional transcriptional regulator/proline dehydrogenase/L-glutamate gamma-semialdehyde dehydrogenase [Acinetobacter calcoaceticus/baumannii complex]|uniref:trifunctional transcriptional regulator/proline dehydrogenase/L-glutamate gamma-semialdehyde dehydrogenase n=1 Tax=Acinetobacter calcoaceticus/baumannii complex TaxID=909768 RepID=UPI00244C6C88|nr:MULTISPECIES: trifunctional transcriptional regulator/proline dehydrogenase/L-glutamate gamma-semialdehyde dehydrogenase [Acinetobacter calcoaceticus/baumannii complex]MDH2595920.1 trifunctional transcriptional regulator/proline dehydrogenase/L-glutamate gamma-semialdehyde dehydrogenase [Acinetobacter baumannii]MDO7536705.1 trifunctional transcriptional regulator/proline dehydrogenase/L-glutamate gamma-semialdehyde dehydrogenase [Acinetobacter pittii]